MPERLGGLGLPEGELGRHIGYDLGIARIARRLAERLDAPLIATGYSRLVVDCNRVPFTPGSIPPGSDGPEIPGQRALDGDARPRSNDRLFDPYHGEHGPHPHLARGPGARPLPG